MSAGNPSATAVVIGGGIVGLMTALELHERGFSVSLLERGAFARESSWAGGGLLCPLPPWNQSAELWALAAAGMDRYPGLCTRLHRATGIDPEWTPSGLTVLEPDDVDAAMAWCRAAGVTANAVKVSRGLARVTSAVHLSWVAQVRNPRLCRALVHYLMDIGVNLFDQVGELQLQVQQGRVVAGASGAQWKADAVIVCAGAWSASLLAPTGWTVPVAPVKGQMLLLRGEPGAVPGLLLQGGRYLIPRQDGRVLVGSTLEHLGFDKGPTDEAASQLRDFADHLVPACRTMTLEAHWAGLRPGTADGVPLVRRHPEVSNLWLHAGHHRYGLTMAPATASILANRITAASG